MGTFEKLFQGIPLLFGCLVGGAITLWVVFYLIDFILWHGGTGINLNLQGELLMDAIFKPTDSLVLGYLLYFWIGVLGGLAGLLFGVVHVLKRK